jgi:hypothetical protein
VIEVQANDRVLVLTAADENSLERIAKLLTSGILVVHVAEERIHELRKALSNAENVMVTAEAEDAIIPWRDGFFTVIWAPELHAATPEMVRVLAPGGKFFFASSRLEPSA